MKTKQITHLTLLGAFLLLCSCRQQPDFARTIIDTPGTFDCFQHQMVVAVAETANHELNYTVSRKQSKVGPSKPPLRKDAQWLIYPQSVDSTWIYDGGTDVTRIQFNADGGAKFTSSQVVPDLLKSAPPAFLERLPQTIRGT